MQNLPETVEIVEVSPRDGIQNEAKILPVETKLELVGRAIAAGVRRMEVTSFVNPKRVPQMADAAELAARLPRGRARYIGLALNLKGFERAAEAGLDEVNFVTVASDTFCRRNQGTDTAENLRIWAEVAAAAQGRIPAAITVGAAFGCPFEGEVDPERVTSLVSASVQAGADEVLLADTIGVAVPAQVLGLARRIAPHLGGRGWGLHLHNTRNTGYANALCGQAVGATVLDAATGGLGGCPFAPRATGNIATEDLLWMLRREGNCGHGVDLAALLRLSKDLCQRVPAAHTGLLVRAGPFPPVPAVNGAAA